MARANQTAATKDMKVANEQEDRFDFIDKVSGRSIKILGNEIIEKLNYTLGFFKIKQNQILSHNTHLVDCCETN